MAKYGYARVSSIGQDLSLQVEALEQYGHNWERISKHIGSKSESQCGDAFVKLQQQWKEIPQEFPSLT